MFHTIFFPWGLERKILIQSSNSCYQSQINLLYNLLPVILSYLYYYHVAWVARLELQPSTQNLGNATLQLCQLSIACTSFLGSCILGLHCGPLLGLYILYIWACIAICHHKYIILHVYIYFTWIQKLEAVQYRFLERYWAAHVEFSLVHPDSSLYIYVHIGCTLYASL